jgi:uncharacterized protein (DUF2164 family)
MINPEFIESNELRKLVKHIQYMLNRARNKNINNIKIHLLLKFIIFIN